MGSASVKHAGKSLCGAAFREYSPASPGTGVSSAGQRCVLTFERCPHARELPAAMRHVTEESYPELLP
jgi:hypothetical protein